MGMSRHDAYYEPEDDYTDSDEFQCEVAELMKDEYNPCNWGNFCEAFEGVQDPEVVAQLEEMLEKRDFMALGRKLWNMSYEYQERFATDAVLDNQ
jgi:hypothetical protein